MATFVVLASFSDQGIQNVKQTVERADAFKHMAIKAGATVKRHLLDAWVLRHRCHMRGARR